MKGQSSSSNSWTGSSSTAVTPSFLQVGDFLDQPGEGARLGHARERMAGEAADVQLVDDGVFERRTAAERPRASRRPAEEQAAAMGALARVVPVSVRIGRNRGRVVRAPRPCPSDDGGAGGVEQDELGIEAMAAAVRPIDAPAVAKGRRQPDDQDVPVVAGAVLADRQRDLAQRVVAVEGQQDEADRRAVAAQQGEIDAVGQGGGAQRQRSSASGAKCVHARAA